MYVRVCVPCPSARQALQYIDEFRRAQSPASTALTPAPRQPNRRPGFSASSASEALSVGSLYLQCLG